MPVGVPHTPPIVPDPDDDHTAERAATTAKSEVAGAPGASDDAGEVAEPRGWRRGLAAWLGRATYEDRQEMLKSLFGDRSARQHFQFALMMWLSVTIAVMGLSLDSAAVVIGAMLIAPLMTPVMQFAGGLALGWPRRMGRAFVMIAAASVLGVAYAWLLARILPNQPLTGEVLSRTAPDLRDLMVALAAGAAGAYATARRDVSTALPGVAVAVALVPPLAAVGLALESDQRDFAEGAALLYTANLVAIVLTGTAVFLATGLVPRRRLRDVTPRVIGGYGAILLVAVVICVPLAARSVAVADRFEEVEAVADRVDSWLGPDSGLEVSDVSVDGSTVTVDVAGPDVPPATDTLAEGASQALGRPVTVKVRWQQRSDLGDGADGKIDVSESELVAIVESGLRAVADGGPTDTVESVEVRDGEVHIELAGPHPPPPANTLAEALAEELGTKPVVRVSWIQRRADESGAGSADGELRRRAQAAAESWERTQTGLDVTDVLYSDGVVTVDVAGSVPPADVGQLVRAVQSAAGREVPVQVRFAERRLLN